MSVRIGIVGLPNVGKSTLFQLITKKQVDIANYPCCTIDPNVGVVEVMDERVDKLAQMENSKRKVYSTIEFYDIAGLVKGASQGQGLGNQFLSHIRETDAILYVLRAFLSGRVVNVQSRVDPIAEKEILETELILKDLETIEKRVEKLKKTVQIKENKEEKKELDILLRIRDSLEKGIILKQSDFDEQEQKIVKSFQFLTTKPRFFLLNGKQEEISPEVIEEFKKMKEDFLIMDVLSEFELSSLNSEERKELCLKSESSIDILIKKAFNLLDLITFLTTGPDESRAWAIKRGTKIPQAGGVIHSDFEKYFIKAEVISFEDLLQAGGYSEAREKGLVKIVGKDYVVQDGDVIEIKHSA